MFRRLFNHLQHACRVGSSAVLSGRTGRLVLLLPLLFVLPVRGEVIELFPTGMTDACDERLEQVWNAAAPGDEIVLNAGVYAQGCARRIHNSGTREAPITVRAAKGAEVLVTRPRASSRKHNNIEITGAWLVIRGLRFQYGSAGVRFMGGSSHIVFEHNTVFDVYDNAIRMNSGDTHGFVLRGNEIYGTGLGGSTGEGMYIGCHDGSCVASDHLIEDNHLHHLRSDRGGGNDGIEIKFRSYGNVVRGNRIHDTTLGQQFPCIFAYGHGEGAPNIIENNVLDNCAEGILVSADAVVRNNVILGATATGIQVKRRAPAPAVRNVQVLNNTVYGGVPVCARFDARRARNVVIANNAFYCPQTRAVSGSFSRATVRNNAVLGRMPFRATDNVRFFAGPATDEAFVDAAGGDLRLRRGSALVDAGAGALGQQSACDHAGYPRVVGASVDVGAFEYHPEVPDGDCQ